MGIADITGCITGIIGCVTGVTSLILTLKQTSFQKGKIIIEQASESYSYYFDSKKFDNVHGWENTKFPVVLSIQITNSSNYNISITKALLTKDDKKVNQHNDFEHDIIEAIPNIREPAPDTYIGEVTYLESYPLTNLPLTLEPFQSIQIAFGFPYAHKLINKYGETLFATLELHTSRDKIIKTPVEIVEYFAHFT